MPHPHLCLHILFQVDPRIGPAVRPTLRGSDQIKGSTQCFIFIFRIRTSSPGFVWVARAGLIIGMINLKTIC